MSMMKGRLLWSNSKWCKFSTIWNPTEMFAIPASLLNLARRKYIKSLICSCNLFKLVTTKVNLQKLEDSYKQLKQSIVRFLYLFISISFGTSFLITSVYRYSLKLNFWYLQRSFVMFPSWDANGVSLYSCFKVLIY